MLPSIQNLFTKITNSIAPFALENLQAEGFPLQLYNEQASRYAVFEEWYKGKPLEIIIIDKATGKPIEKYPIKINPIKGTCQKHAARVIGQNVDSIRFGGLPFQLVPDVEKAKKKQAKVVEDALRTIFSDNSFGSSFLSTCIRAQYLGGAIIKMKWIPDEKTIEISTPKPAEFVGFPDGANEYRLREAWMVKEITQAEAEALGYIKQTFEDKFWYIEHWTKQDYKIQVNNQVLTFEDGAKQQGENPFKLVPIVYIPHIRVDSFLGDSIITETVKGVIKELNLRWADIGDAVSADSHDYVAVANVSGGISTINVGDNRPVLDLGQTSGIGSNAEPKMWAVGTKSASESMLKFVDDLYGVYRREVNHPAVADGEDEGSQRSSLTLATRMAPLVDEAEFERLFWTVGMTEVARIILTICNIKNLHNITEELIKTPLYAQWQPMLPRDREAMSTEAAVRSKNKITSRKKLNQMYGDVADVDEDMEQIKDEAELDQVASPFGAKPGAAGVQPNNPKQQPQKSQ
jgi:hypothetical protein